MPHAAAPAVHVALAGCKGGGQEQVKRKPKAAEEGKKLFHDISRSCLFFGIIKPPQHGDGLSGIVRPAGAGSIFSCNGPGLHITDHLIGIPVAVRGCLLHLAGHHPSENGIIHGAVSIG